MKLAAMHKTKMMFCTLIIALLSVSAFGQAGLTLGQKFVPRDSIYLYLFFGNSVMSGRDTPADTITNNQVTKAHICIENTKSVQKSAGFSDFFPVTETPGIFSLTPYENYF